MLFSDELITARQRRHLSKVALAAESGLSYKHLDNLEKGRRRPTLSVLRQLDRCLKFPTHVLVELIRCGDREEPS